jgi:hypothetical protein
VESLFTFVVERSHFHVERIHTLHILCGEKSLFKFDVKRNLSSHLMWRGVTSNLMWRGVTSKFMWRGITLHISRDEESLFTFDVNSSNIMWRGVTLQI